MLSQARRDDNLRFGKFTQAAFREMIEDCHLFKGELTFACNIYMRTRIAGSGGTQNI